LPAPTHNSSTPRRADETESASSHIRPPANHNTTPAPIRTRGGCNPPSLQCQRAAAAIAPQILNRYEKSGLAASGYVGIKRVFEREYGGYLAVFGEGHHPDANKICAGLGSVWETESIAVKAYAAMGLLHAAIDAALQLRAAGGVVADEIVRIDIYLPKAAYGLGGWQPERPLAPIGAQMNVMYAIAVALLDGGVLIDQFAEDRINRDDVWNLIGRTRAHHEKAYDALPVEERLTTRVVVTLKTTANFRL
jgi:aconitate decarboxylase